MMAKKYVFDTCTCTALLVGAAMLVWPGAATTAYAGNIGASCHAQKGTSGLCLDALSQKTCEKTVNW